MPRTSGAPNQEILEAALHGLEAQREKLDEQIAQVRRLLGSRGSRRTKAATAGDVDTPAKSGRKKRTLTAEARKRIAAAQKKRWAAFRKTQS
jgi:peptidoglycan hydrolase CwlO-like protein